MLVTRGHRPSKNPSLTSSLGSSAPPPLPAEFPLPPSRLARTLVPSFPCTSLKTFFMPVVSQSNPLPYQTSETSQIV